MKKSSLVVLIFACVFGQLNVNFSLETKYGNGSQITSLGSATPDTSDYRYFENILDINSFYSDNVYLYLQLEYSDPPIYGFNMDGVNALYFEYNQDKLGVKLGDIYEMTGRGVSFRTFQDQNIDFDNSQKGIELSYDLHENITLFSLLGQGEYNYRGNIASVLPDRSIRQKTVLIGSDIYTNGFGDFTFLYFENEQELSLDLILSYEAEIYDNRLSRDLFERISPSEIAADTVIYFNRTIGWNKSIGVIDIYIEKAWNNYTKLLGEKVNGSMFYAALSADIINTGITYEFKNYNMPFLIQSVSNPPTVIRETSSVLTSRNNHAVIFGDELGHQLEINRDFLLGSHLLANISLSNRQVGYETNEYVSFNLIQDNGSFSGIWQTDSTMVRSTDNPTLFDLISFSEDNNVISHYPYRQIYGEINGWGMNDQLFYKIGFDQNDEITKYHDMVNYLPVSTMTDEELSTYLFDYYYDFYWEIWNQNYYPEYGFDSTYVNGWFEFVYGAPIDSVIIADYTGAYDDVSPQLNDLLVSERNYEKVTAFTIPTQFAFDLNKIGGFTIYFEKQWKKIITNKDKIYSDGTIVNDLSNDEKYDLDYFSVSYQHPIDLSVTLFYETENYKKKIAGETWAEGYNDWFGIDLSYYLNDNSQLSVFYGSQKGGRVCANGICADLPGFDDGIKITFRSIF